MATIAQLPYLLSFRAVNFWLADSSRRHLPVDRSRIAAFIAGLLVTAKAATATAVAEGGAYSHDAMRRLLIGPSLRPVVHYAALCQADRTRGYLVIDDVVISKEGPAIEGIARLFSPGEKKHVLGLNVVVLGWTDGKRYVPLSFRFWKPPASRDEKRKPSYLAFDGDRFKTKLELAVDLLDWARERGFEPTAVLFDAYYLADNVLHYLKAVKWQWVSRIKANRVLKVNGKRFQPQHWAAKAAADEVVSPAKSLKAVLKRWGEARLIGVKPTRRSTEFRYLIGSNPNWSRHVIERLYKHRWGIETGFRTENQLAGLKDCQSRRFDAQQNHFALVLLAHLFLTSQQRRQETPGGYLDRLLHAPIAADGGFKPAKVRSIKQERKLKPLMPRQATLSDLCA